MSGNEGGAPKVAEEVAALAPAAGAGTTPADRPDADGATRAVDGAGQVPDVATEGTTVPAAAADVIATSPMPAPSTSDPETAPSAQDLAAMAAAVEAARPMPRPLTPDELAAAATVEAVTTESIQRSRRARAGGWLIRLATLAIGLGLLAGGYALGMTAYQRLQPAQPAIGDVSTGGVATPSIVTELSRALSSNDADSLRSAVSGEPYRLLAGELERRTMQGVTSVDILATMQDGPRSATEIVINGRTVTGLPVTFNLVVHVSNNQIVTFR